MSSQAQLDLLIQLRPAVVVDTFTRVLNDPLTTDPQSAAALPRRIHIAVPGMLLWWDTPGLALNDDGTITVSVALAGGIRQAPAPGDGGRIASVSGTLKARMKPIVGQPAGSPITLELDTIDQSGLRASYAGSNPTPLLGVGGARAEMLQAVVRDAVSVLVAQPALINFLRGLGRRPLIPDPAAFPVEAAPSGGHPLLYWPKGGKVLAVGAAQPGAAGDMARAELGLLARADSNAAVTVSSAYLTAKLRSLLASGALPRSLPDDAGNELAELEGIEARVGAGELLCAARVVHSQVHATLNAALVFAPDSNSGRVAVGVRRMTVEIDTIPASIPDALGTATALSALPNRLARSYWLGIMAALFGAAIVQGELDLTQRYVVLGTQVAMSGRATALELANDALTIYAALPTDAVFVPQPPHRQPKVAVVQDPLHIPTQSAPGQSVNATVTAMLTAPSYEPYDYAWGAANVQHVAGEHAQSFTVRGIPPGTGIGAGAVVEELAKASVTVIDAFGQTDDASGPVLVRPARRSQPSQPRPRPRKLARILIPAALIAAVIVGSGLAFGGNFIHPQPPNLPQPLIVTPQTDYQQTCTPAVPSLPPIFVMLDNSRNTATITWTATAQGTVPGGSEAWASLNGGGASATSTLHGGQTAVLTIQPANDLCATFQNAATSQHFTVSISYSLTGSGTYRQSGVAAPDALALAGSSRQITLSDTIGFSDFSAYVVGATRLPTTVFAQACDQRLTVVPRELVVVLDNRRGVSAAQWQLSVPDQVPTTGSPVEPWASADVSSGTVAAGQLSHVVVLLTRDLCQQLLNETAPVPLRLVVLANGRNPVTLMDTITPPPHVASLSIQPATFQQSCASGLQPTTVTLDSTQSDVPVTWQVGAVDSVAPPGTPTPASGEPWASVSPSSGTLSPGANGTTTVTITPTSDLCGQFLPVGSANTYSVTFSYDDNGAIAVTDTISNPIP